MFANYNYDEFPLVKVTFTGSIQSEMDFTLFKEQWLKRPRQYLTHSTILNVNSFTKYLLWIVFKIQSPVAPVEIVYMDGSRSTVVP